MTDDLLELSRVSNRLSQLVTGIIKNYSQGHTDAEDERCMVYSHGECHPSNSISMEETKVFRKEGKDYDGQRSHDLMIETMVKTETTCFPGRGPRASTHRRQIQTGDNLLSAPYAHGLLLLTVGRSARISSGKTCTVAYAYKSDGILFTLFSEQKCC